MTSRVYTYWCLNRCDRNPQPQRVGISWINSSVISNPTREPGERYPYYMASRDKAYCVVRKKEELGLSRSSFSLDYIWSWNRAVESILGSEYAGRFLCGPRLIWKEQKKVWWSKEGAFFVTLRGFYFILWTMLTTRVSKTCCMSQAWSKRAWVTKMQGMYAEQIVLVIVIS